MTHSTVNMMSKEGPTECLGCMVSDVDNTRDVAHDNDAMSLPLLNGKVLNVDVA